MSNQKNIASKLSTSRLVIIGLICLLVGNAFTLTFMNVKLHELLANLGALFLLVGTLQWFFDENSRQSLVSQVSENVREYLNNRDRFSELGITDCLIDSKGISANGAENELIGSNKLAIGVHYSDGTIVRFEKVIKERTAEKKTSQLVHVKSNCTAAQYLSTCLSHPVDVALKVEQFKQVVKARFTGSEYIKLIEHDRVLRYSFVYSDKSIWIIFMTNTDSYCPQIPALRVAEESELFNFFKQDIQNLGIDV